MLRSAERFGMWNSRIEWCMTDDSELIVRRTKWYECTEVCKCRLGSEQKCLMVHTVAKSWSKRYSHWLTDSLCCAASRSTVQCSAGCGTLYSVALSFHSILFDLQSHQVWMNDEHREWEERGCRGWQARCLHITSFHTIKFQQRTVCDLYGSLLLSPHILFYSLCTIIEHFIT